MKKAKYFWGTILLGALGSAFWEICLKKGLLLIINKLMPYLIQSRRDSFYSHVPSSLNLISFYYFLVFMNLFAVFFLIMAQIYLLRFTPKILRKQGLKFVVSSMPLSFTVSFVISYTCFTGIQTSVVARNTTNNIEIVAPYITDDEYKQLRSDFFQIDSKADYDNLINKISAIAEKKHLQLK